MGTTCVGGSCTPCNGCIDVTTGNCLNGTTNTQCGRNGGFCQTCDTMAGQQCTSGQCVGTGACSPSNCNGCCSGSSCFAPNQQNNARCGNGSPGAACIACTTGSTCDTVSGFCAPDGVDGGFDFDGGLPLTCTMDSECGTGCCGMFAGFGLCFAAGQSCFVGVCNPVTRDCE